MSSTFEELAYVRTALGYLSLRRQRLMMFGGREIHEIKLNDEYLMSSLFTDVEVALAKLAVAAVEEASPDIVVGGLGLGYTAAAVLDHAQVNELLVIDALLPVIEWHQQRLVPLGARIAADPRCRLICGDFFAMTEPEAHGFDPAQPDRLFHAILLDIDHAPRHLLHANHARFYGVEGLQALRRHLHRRGVFAMWSDSPVDAEFLQDLRNVFTEARAEVVSFPNPFLEHDSASIVYIARRD